MESKQFENIKELLLKEFNSQELVISMMVDNFEKSGRELFNRIKDKLTGASTEDDFNTVILEIIKEADEFISGKDEVDLNSLTDEETVKLIFYNSLMININTLYTKAQEDNLDGID